METCIIRVSSHFVLLENMGRALEATDNNQEVKFRS